MNYESNNLKRPQPSLKYLSPYDIYDVIDKCQSKVLRVTYCSLTLNKQCMNTKTSKIKITKIYKESGFIEGLILKDGEPFENIILKSNQILKVECVKGDKPDGLSVYDKIKECNGLVRITQCIKIENGECVRRNTFPFFVSEIDKKNNNIKGYVIRENEYPKYTVIDVSLILNVSCLSKDYLKNFPINIIPFIFNNQNKN